MRLRNTAVDDIQVNSCLLGIRKIHFIYFPPYLMQKYARFYFVSLLIPRVVNGNNLFSECDPQVPLRNTAVDNIQVNRFKIGLRITPLHLLPPYLVQKYGMHAFLHRFLVL